MRACMYLFPLLLLAACGGSGTSKAVDPVRLPPLSGKEQALIVAAEGALHSNDSATAERDYLEAVGKSQGHVEAHLSLADLYLKQNQPTNAQAVLEKAAEFQPKHPRVNYLLGKIAVAQNKPQEALEYFHHGLDSAPEDFDLLNGAAIAHDMLRENSLAQILYKRAMAANPKADLSMTRTNLAMSYLLSNQPKKTVELLKPEVKKPGASAVARHNLALAYGMLGKNTEAKALVSKDMTEEERQMALARLREYLSSPATAGKPPAVAHN